MKVKIMKEERSKCEAERRGTVKSEKKKDDED